MHVVHLQGLADELSAHFTVSHTHGRYAMHVWLYHLLGGQRAGMLAPTDERRAAATTRIGQKCARHAADHQMAAKALAKARWKAAQKQDAAVTSAAERACQDHECSTATVLLDEVPRSAAIPASSSTPLRRSSCSSCQMTRRRLCISMRPTSDHVLRVADSVVGTYRLVNVLLYQAGVHFITNVARSARGLLGAL